MENLKPSYVDKKVVDKMIKWMKGLYGQDMRVSRGKNHYYLRMILESSLREQVAVTMVDYLEGVISNFEEVEMLTGTAASPDAEHLCAIREESNQKKIDEKRATAFHHAVAQLIFACPRARKDIQTTVYFLTKIVHRPNEDDWGGLKHVLRYVRRTINLPLILRAYSLTVIKWWVDASYLAHPDMRGQAGTTMSLRRGSVIGITKKHRINAKSSTEAELIGADDTIPQMLWTRCFIKAQGFTINKSVLLEDNISAMLLEWNGMVSKSNPKKHIRVRYYFIKDRISTGGIVVKHFPIREMLAYHFTKPLQGALFKNSGRKYKESPPP